MLPSSAAPEFAHLFGRSPDVMASALLRALRELFGLSPTCGGLDSQGAVLVARWSCWPNGAAGLKRRGALPPRMRLAREKRRRCCFPSNRSDCLAAR